MEWKTVDRPGQSGLKKDEITAEWNLKYGKNKWRKAWVFGDEIMDQQQAFKICEDAYYADSINRPEVWTKLIKEAKDIYDFFPEEVDSGLDYFKQHKLTRFHDICIRRVLSRNGWKFQGAKLIQIRFDKDNPNWFSENFDPGKVQFHLREFILKPNLEGWWNKYSIEDFYQSNKLLQVKKIN